MADEDFFAEDTGSNKEYEEMMAKKKAEADAAKAKEADASKAKKKEKPVLKSAVVLEVKPLEAETDLDALVKTLHAIQMDGLEWKSHQFIPVAYGVKKIGILLHAVDDVLSVDDLVEKIEAIEDVSSVEVGSFTKL
jgi:translation elongation factor EF-1beta